MFKMLKSVHPGKASMLGAEAFKIKVMKIESRESKKKKFSLGMGNHSQMSHQDGMFSTMQSSHMED